MTLAAAGLPGGSPLSMAILGVSSLERALAFYRDVIGLDAGEPWVWRGSGFEAHWKLPAGSSARAALLHAGASEVGRILLLEFDAAERRQVRRAGERALLGLWNLNFYVRDIRAASRELEAMGYSFWSEPVGYDLSRSVGSPIEVIFEGPDGVLINLVEPAGGDAGSVIARLRRYLDEPGVMTRTGFTAVSTTSHCVFSSDQAAAFYKNVLGLETLIDEEMSKPESNRFLHRPADARTRATFLKGSHWFGKVALSHPLNYRVEDRVSLAVAPNIGYLAQSFRVPKIDAAIEACERSGAAAFSPKSRLEIPPEGECAAILVRCPGSRALIQIVESR